jgi:Ribonuclease P
MAGLRNIPIIPAIRIHRSIGPANLLHIYYTPLFAPWRPDRENLTPSSVFYAKLMDSYENAPRDTLRWQVVANTAAKEVPKAVMRERLRRRVREAFRQALKETGYDSNGKVLPSVPDSKRPVRDLRGTLEIHCRGPAGLGCGFREVVEVAKGAVQSIVKSHNQSSDHHESSPPAYEWWKPSVAGDRPPVRAQQRLGA